MNEQEQFWSGEFGTKYQERQKETTVGCIASNVALFNRILRCTSGVKRIIEFGAGTGQNLEAIHHARPEVHLTGVEINPVAAGQIKSVARVLNVSLLDLEIDEDVVADLAFTKGLLIHIAPSDLPKAYAKLYASARRYILVAEYYNPTPVEVEYRGHAGKLWKRDFAGELLDAYADLRLVDSGFAWRRAMYPQDDITWFLLEKVPA